MIHAAVAIAEIERRSNPLNLPSAAAMLLVSDLLGLSQQQREAACALLYQLGKRLPDHHWNLIHNGRLAIPTCIQFGRCGGVISQHAATVAFDALGLREATVSTQELRAMGFDVPPARARYRWIVFDHPDQRRVYREAHDALLLLGIDAPHPEEDTAPYQPFVPTELPVPDGKPVAVLCPFHADTRPSATIFPLGPAGHGGGCCHRCHGPDGRALRFCWRKMPDGTYGARIARVHRDQEIHVGPKDTGRRYNVTPIGARVPSPARVSHVYGTSIGVSLSSFIGRSGAWVRTTTANPLRGDVIEAIIRSEVTGDYGNIRPKVTEHEFEAAARREHDAEKGRPDRPGNADAKDRLIRVQPQFSTETTTLRSGVSIRSGWKDAGVVNVLLDLDGLCLGDDRTAEAWAARVVEVVKRDKRCSGRVTVVRTSARGAQVVVELARPIAGRLPGEAWFAAPGPRDWYADLGERLLAAAWSLGGEGGEIDWSAFSPGRCARRPGWRVTRDGTAYRARLLAAA